MTAPAFVRVVQSPATGSGPKPPLLVLLHGVGSHERDLLPLAPEIDPRFLILSLRAPYEVGPNRYAWFEVALSPISPVIRADQAEASRKRLSETIPGAAAELGADPARVYLLGFSQGAILALALALTTPKLLAGVIAASGRTLPEMFQTRGPLAGKLASDDDLRGLPVLVVHGTQDPVLPVEFARDTRRILERTPMELSYSELPMGHTISDEARQVMARWASRHLNSESAWPGGR